MKNIACTLLISSLLLVPACTKESAAASLPPGAAPQQTPTAPAAGKAAPAATPAIADLPKVLAGIKDAASAEAAKGPLEGIVQQLEAAKSKAAAAPAAAGTDLGKLAGETATKLGISPDTVAQVTALLANPAIKAVIGPTLEKLQGLLK